MKKHLFLLFIAIVAASCSPIKVTTDFDRSANFGSYKTYAFTPEAQSLPVDDLNRNRILTAITNELTAKGFTKSDKPDVLVNIYVKTQQVATASGTTDYYGAHYRYRWGGGFSTTSIDINTYTEGTLFIDMIDASKGQMVWQGRGTATLNPDASPQKKEENINYAVKQILMKYPPVK